MCLNCQCAFETEGRVNGGWWDVGGAAITRSGGSLKPALWMEVTLWGNELLGLRFSFITVNSDSGGISVSPAIKLPASYSLFFFFFFISFKERFNRKALLSDETEGTYINPSLVLGAWLVHAIFRPLLSSCSLASSSIF